MRIRSINGNVLTVDGGGHFLFPGDRLSADDNVDGTTLRAGSMLVKDVQVGSEDTAVTVDSVVAGNAVTLDYLFVTHSRAEQERADRAANALAGLLPSWPSVKVRAVAEWPRGWRMVWSFEP